MKLVIANDRQGLGEYSASIAADYLRTAIRERGEARLIVATGSSQFQVLEALAKSEGIDWSRVDGFHLDEYIGLGINHAASFCGYLKQRFVDLVPLRSFLFLDGLREPNEVCREAGRAVQAKPIDVALVGIGENGHLAFNDPPADFETKEAYHV